MRRKGGVRGLSPKTKWNWRWKCTWNVVEKCYIICSDITLLFRCKKVGRTYVHHPSPSTTITLPLYHTTKHIETTPQYPFHYHTISIKFHTFNFLNLLLFMSSVFASFLTNISYSYYSFHYTQRLSILELWCIHLLIHLRFDPIS